MRVQVLVLPDELLNHTPVAGASVPAQNLGV